MAVHSVSEVNRYIKGVIEREGALRRLMVRGELSNFKTYSSGHCYFTLKDARAALKCVMFRSRAQYLRFQPQNGMKVLASGGISVYERDGVYQLYVDTLALEGQGELSEALAARKDRLAAEGLFSPEHKQPLPRFPKRIGVVTSLSGAVLRDIYHVGKRRDPSVQLVLYPVQVQGEQSAAQVAEAIRFFNAHVPVDVLIVGRGGGSMEDLWSFNEEVVVRAIFASKIPVISAVGHETDYTLADYASDVRAATPSQAAELAIPDRREILRQVQGLGIRLRQAASTGVDLRRERLRRLRERPVFEQPEKLLATRRQTLDMLRERLWQSGSHQISEKERQYESLLARLELLNPVHVLTRGYALVERRGKPVTRVRELKAGEQLTLVFADGRAKATVNAMEKKPTEGATHHA